MSRTVLTLVFFCFGSPLFADVCDEWFKGTGVAFGEKCLLSCASSITGLRTFRCPEDCARLCKENLGTNALFQLTDLYPSLTDAERALASKYPVKTLKAYQLSLAAESQCLLLYRSSELNDESDACRHFLWAGLLHQEFGRDFAEEILYAHEQEPGQPEEQKGMDLANNQRGASIAEVLIKNKKFSEAAMVDAFKKQLKIGNLVVLKKRASEELRK